MTPRPAILIADDEAVNRRLMSAVFASHDFEVIAVETGAEALKVLESRPVAVAIFDVRMPGWSGIETLRRARGLVPDLPVVMVTAHAEVVDAVEAIKAGAYDFLVRPVPAEKLLLVAHRAIERRNLEGEVRDLRRRVAPAGDLVRLMGPGEKVRRLVLDVEEVSETPLTVLLLGETGTGKELVARAVHHQSGRPGPFVPLDCGAMPETLIESELFGHEKGAFSGADRRREGHLQAASGGTLFLDEVGNLSSSAQAKLLRVLQERVVQPVGSSRALPIDVRVIAATNGQLSGQVARGAFRQDLFYRLAEFTLNLPPLRERPEDIVPLAQRFLEEAGLELRRPVTGLSREAAAILCAHQWPGNVRELRNVIRQAVLQSREMLLGAGNLGRLMGQFVTSPGSEPQPEPESYQPEPRTAPAGASLKEISALAIEGAERHAIIDMLRRTHWNKSEAARLLRTDFKTLHLKIRRYGLSRRATEPLAETPRTAVAVALVPATE